MVATRINLGEVIVSKEVEKEWGGYPGWFNLISVLLECHRRGDWGNLSIEEEYINESVIKCRVELGKLTSLYDLPGGRVRIATDNPFGNPTTTVSIYNPVPNHLSEPTAPNKVFF